MLSTTSKKRVMQEPYIDIELPLNFLLAAVLFEVKANSEKRLKSSSSLATFTGRKPEVLSMVRLAKREVTIDY